MISYIGDVVGGTEKMSDDMFDYSDQILTESLMELFTWMMEEKTIFPFLTFKDFEGIS